MVVVNEDECCKKEGREKFPLENADQIRGMLLCLCSHYAGEIRNNHRPFRIRVLGQRNHTSDYRDISWFLKSSLFKKFSVDSKMQSRRFEIPSL